MNQPGSSAKLGRIFSQMVIGKGYTTVLWFFLLEEREGEIQRSRKVVMSSWEIMFNKHMDREKGVRDGKQRQISSWTFIQGYAQDTVCRVCASDAC